MDSLSCTGLANFTKLILLPYHLVNGLRLLLFVAIGDDAVALRMLRGLVKLFPPAATRAKGHKKVSAEEAMKYLIQQERVCYCSF